MKAKVVFRKHATDGSMWEMITTKHNHLWAVVHEDFFIESGLLSYEDTLQVSEFVTEVEVVDE